MTIFYFNLCVLLIVLPNCFSNPVSISNKHRKLSQIPLLKEHEIPANIIGGKKVDISKRAYQVAIKVDNVFLGSGIIINKNWVVTVATVVYGTDASNITLLAENANYLKGKKYDVSEIVIHPEFDFFELENDIALLKLSKPITKFKKTLQSITIGSSSLADGTTVTLSGWGDRSDSDKVKKNESPQLTKGNLEIVNLEECRSHYDSYEIFNSTICAFKKNFGPCWNDFGDVITSKDKKAYGLFSWSKGCHVNEYPSIYTNLVYFNPWIKSVVGSKKSKRNPRSLPETSEEVADERFYGNEIEKELIDDDEEEESSSEEDEEIEDEILSYKGKEVGNNKAGKDKTEEENVGQETFSNAFYLLQNINKNGIPLHFIKKRNADSFKNNFQITEDDEIREAIKLEVEEEENADKEEQEQEEVEDEYEREAIGIVKAVAENEKLFKENEDANELEQQEVDEIIEGRHLINKRDVTNYGESNENLDNEIIEKAIMEEEKIEANAEEEELQQEEDEDEAEIEAEKLILGETTETFEQDVLMNNKNFYHFVGPYSKKIAQYLDKDVEEQNLEENFQNEEPEDTIEAFSKGYEFLSENEEDPLEYNA